MLKYTCKGLHPNEKAPTKATRKQIYYGFEELAGWPGPLKEDSVSQLPVVAGEALYIDLENGTIYRIDNLEEFYQHLSDYTGVGNKTKLIRVKVEEVLPEHVVAPALVS